jgi:competence protein ComEA
LQKNQRKHWFKFLELDSISIACSKESQVIQFIHITDKECFHMKNILSAFVFSVLAFSSFSFAADAPAKPAAAIQPQGAKPASQQAAVNINTADAQTLTQLKGIGLKKAEAIVAWRKANGNFKTIDQLAEVKGIGAKTIDLNRQNIRLQ